MNQLLETAFRNQNYNRAFLRAMGQGPHKDPKDTDKLCEYLKEIHDKGDQIVCLDDFDVDGIMSGVISFAGLAELGFNVCLYVPDVKKGYGFDAATIDDLMAKYPKTKAILTADTGITCYEGVSHAKKLGLKMLVTDHHMPQGKIDADVVVDPSREDDDSGLSFIDVMREQDKDAVDTHSSGICGAHVMYKVLCRYAYTYCDQFTIAQIERLCVFAGIGTVADSMPMYCENRALVKSACEICRMVYAPEDGVCEPSVFVNSIPGCPIYRRAFHGLYVIMKEFYTKKTSAVDKPKLYEDFFGFYLNPAFNSIKRMAGDLNQAYDVFFGGTSEASMSALYVLNQQRQRLVEKGIEQINSTYQPWAPYVYVTDMGSGLRGLLAQRLMGQDGLPKIVVGLDIGNSVSKYVGSGRSPAYFPFLDATAGHSWHAAGHNGAFGIGFPNEDSIQELCDFLASRTIEIQPEDMPCPYDVTVSMFGDGDADFDLGMITQYIDEEEMYHPYGPGFREPVVRVSVNTSLVEFYTMGDKSQHLKIMLPSGIQLVDWNAATAFLPHLQRVTPDPSDEIHTKPYYKSVGLPDRLDFLGHFQYNYFRGNRSVQFMGSLMEGQGIDA